MSHDKRIAVAVIHGMGSQGDAPQNIDSISFSAGLYNALRGYLRPGEWNDRVVYREIFWADVLQTRQEAYLAKITADGARWRGVRDFVMHRLTDAAAYTRTGVSARDPDDQSLSEKERRAAEEDIYRQIHARVAATIRRLQEIAGADAPLLIFAHSLGGHIISNYAYDLQRKTEVVEVSGDFQRLKTMAGLLTFGCNIPVFTFAYPPGKVRPIDYPGTAIPKERRLAPWWLNLNDRNDVLGMPLGPAGDAYAEMVANGEIADRWISVGSIVTGWNPASHNAYWTDRDFCKQAGGMIRQALAIAEA
ncbi:MAG: hypothetical protein HLUCCO18_17235 [Rhodobacteraceae bacterium HLUCCO18]|nr:MAG: hypothetical protein HLUCCO18_17235 [Rhodobacteraceae bacterium HLUCCO18]